MTVSMTADRLDLSAFLKTGDRIVIGQACGEPTTLIEKLIEQAPSIGSLSTFVASSFSGIFNVDAADRIALWSMGAIGALRPLAAAGRLNIIPCHVSQVGPLIEQGIIGCDVAFVQVSPADEEGHYSFGLISDHVQAAVAKARVVIAEVNDQVPYTFGALLPTGEIDCAVHVSRPTVDVRAGTPGEVEQAIARHVAAYIGDGAVLQVGVGGVPEAVIRLITDRRNLGVHSGMIGDGVVDLIEAGVVTNAEKPFDKGVCITGALIGSKRLYVFAHRNPQIGMRSSAYTHGDAVLSALPNLIALNSAVEVDLTGQVNAELTGSYYLGGTGGQVDFLRAASRSPTGRGIVALPATAQGGRVSRITAALAGPVTTARTDVDVIVTEYGAAELRGQSLAERARRMTAIAHPDFREKLERATREIERKGF